MQSPLRSTTGTTIQLSFSCRTTSRPASSRWGKCSRGEDQAKSLNTDRVAWFRQGREPLTTVAQQIQQIEEQVQHVQVKLQGCDDVIRLAARHDARGVVQDIAAEDQGGHRADRQVI